MDSCWRRHALSRIQSPSGGHTIIFDRQFGGVAGKVYAQLVSGERIPENAIMFCPFAGIPYYHYELTFSHAGIQTGVASSDAHGCQVIELNSLGGGRDLYYWYAANWVSFWETLHQLANAPLPV